MGDMHMHMGTARVRVCVCGVSVNTAAVRVRVGAGVAVLVSTLVPSFFACSPLSFTTVIGDCTRSTIGAVWGGCTFIRVTDIT